jgi:predicted transcriptional regulator
MQRTQIYLTESQQKRLRVLARRQATTHSALIREAIDRLLDEPRAANVAQQRQAAFGAWAADAKRLTPQQLRREERLAEPAA